MKGFWIQLKLILQNRVALILQIFIIASLVVIVLLTYIGRVQVRQISYYNDIAPKSGTMVVDFWEPPNIVVTDEIITELEAQISRPIEKLEVRNQATILENQKDSYPVEVIQLPNTLPENVRIIGVLPVAENEILLSKSTWDDLYQIGDVLQYIDKETENLVDLVIVGWVDEDTMDGDGMIVYTGSENFNQMTEPAFRRLHLEIDYQVKAPDTSFEKSVVGMIYNYFMEDEKSIEEITIQGLPSNIDYYIQPNPEQNQETDYHYKIILLSSQVALIVLTVLSILFLVLSWYRFSKSRQTQLMLYLRGTSKTTLFWQRLFIVYVTTVIGIALGLYIFSLIYNDFVIAIQELLKMPNYTVSYYAKTAVSLHADIYKITSIFVLLVLGGITMITILEVIFNSMFDPIRQYFKIVGEEVE